MRKTRGKKTKGKAGIKRRVRQGLRLVRKKKAARAAKAGAGKPIRAKTKAVEPLVHVAVVLDRSGSMAACRQETIDGLNEYLGHLRAQTNVQYRFSLTQFDSHSIDNLYVDVPLVEVAPRTVENFVPRGGTPLFDAVGQTIRAVEERVPRGPVLFVIQTDGQENASQEWTREAIFAEIKVHEGTRGWTFVFLGADQNAFAQSSLMGISVGNTMAYRGADTQHAYSMMATATQTYSANVLKGMSSTAAFYQDAGLSVDARDPDKTKTGAQSSSHITGAATTAKPDGPLLPRKVETEALGGK